MTKTNYRGNVNLKPVNFAINFTEEQVQEYIKCAKDPIYFIENYIQVVNVDKGLVPLTMYDYQKKVVKTAFDNRYVICRIPRQAGKTTCVSAFALHQILFNPNYNVLIAANKASTAYEVMKKVQIAFEHLPYWLKQGIIKFNASTIELENGSRCMASSTSADSARGFAFNCLNGEAVIKIRNKNSGEIKEVNFDEFASILNNSEENGSEETWKVMYIE